MFISEGLPGVLENMGGHGSLAEISFFNSHRHNTVPQCSGFLAASFNWFPKIRNVCPEKKTSFCYRAPCHYQNTLLKIIILDSASVAVLLKISPIYHSSQIVAKKEKYV